MARNDGDSWIYCLISIHHVFSYSRDVGPHLDWVSQISYPYLKLKNRLLREYFLIQQVTSGPAG